MGDVIGIGGKKYFTLDEARTLLPLVKRITTTSEEEVRALLMQHEYANETRKREVEERIKVCVQDWQDKLHKLGCETKGMWLVDFDSGEGYYCWNFPEPELGYYHGYEDGFKGRVKIH